MTVIFLIIASLSFLAFYLFLGKRYALSDVDRIVTGAVRQGNALTAQDRRIREEYFRTIICWPYFWSVNRLLHGLDPLVEQHPLRAEARLRQLEARENEERALALKRARETEKLIEQQLTPKKSPPPPPPSPRRSIREYEQESLRLLRDLQDAIIQASRPQRKKYDS